MIPAATGRRRITLFAALARHIRPAGVLFVVLAPSLSGAGCAPSLFEPRPPAAKQCLPGQLWVCEERHDRPTHDNRKSTDEFEHCSCEDVRF